MYQVLQYICQSTLINEYDSGYYTKPNFNCQGFEKLTIVLNMVVVVLYEYSDYVPYRTIQQPVQPMECERGKEFQTVSF